MLPRKLLLLSYSFPPSNIIGAVRPYQIANFFKQKGWDVYVVACRDPGIVENYKVDISEFNITNVVASPIVAWIGNGQPATTGFWSKAKNKLSRVLRFGLRAISFPEHYVFMKKGFVCSSLRLAESNRFDLVVSSALPFTMHVAAREVAKKLSLPWVADNRDLWAVSPYRKEGKGRKVFDTWYEARILRDAKVVTGVSQAMVDYYRNNLGLRQSSLVMNGYSLASSGMEPVEYVPSLPAGRDRLKIVYGGGLYGGLRDPSPLLDAIAEDPDLKDQTRIDFYGSEPDCVAKLQLRYPDCGLYCHGRLTKNEIAEVYKSSDILLVVLGRGAFEGGVMTGKFFEYLAFCKPVLAIAPEGSELARVVSDHKLGLATSDAKKIASYLRSILRGSASPISGYPKELTINNQLERLYRAISDSGDVR